MAVVDPTRDPSVNKVVINNKTVVDMTLDTAAADDVVVGKFFHSASGKQQSGTMRELSTLANSFVNPTTQGTTFTIQCTNSGATGYVLGEEEQRVAVVLDKAIFGAALQEQVLEGKTFTSTAGIHVVGTMANKGAAAIELSDLNAKAVAAGYYSGGTAKIADAEAAKVIPGNIKKGVTLFGVEGTLQDGPYSIASTDNDDGSQNLAITDAQGNERGYIVDVFISNSNLGGTFTHVDFVAAVMQNSTIDFRNSADCTFTDCNFQNSYIYCSQEIKDAILNGSNNVYMEDLIEVM